jgi:hypothetical protein
MDVSDDTIMITAAILTQSCPAIMRKNAQSVRDLFSGFVKELSDESLPSKNVTLAK